jgi:hypothetical protein
MSGGVRSSLAPWLEARQFGRQDSTAESRVEAMLTRYSGSPADKIDRPITSTDDGGAFSCLGAGDKFGIGRDQKVGGGNVWTGYFAQWSIAEIT